MRCTRNRVFERSGVESELTFSMELEDGDLPGTESLNGVGSELTFSMELEDGESNKKRKIEEAKETERLSPF